MICELCLSEYKILKNTIFTRWLHLCQIRCGDDSQSVKLWR